MSRNVYKTPHSRGANMMEAGWQRMDSADGSRWALSRIVRAEVHRNGRVTYDPIRKYWLRHRVNGKVTDARTTFDRIEAIRWVDRRDQLAQTNSGDSST